MSEIACLPAHLAENRGTSTNISELVNAQNDLATHAIRLAHLVGAACFGERQNGLDNRLDVPRIDYIGNLGELASIGATKYSFTSHPKFGGRFRG